MTKVKTWIESSISLVKSTYWPKKFTESVKTYKGKTYKLIRSKYFSTFGRRKWLCPFRRVHPENFDFLEPFSAQKREFVLGDQFKRIFFCKSWADCQENPDFSLTHRFLTVSYALVSDCAKLIASIYDRKTAARPFDTTYDILRYLSLVQSHPKDRNAPIWCIGNLRVKCTIRQFWRNFKDSSVLRIEFVSVTYKWKWMSTLL